jgi:CRP/FNR family transcriptional regulator
MYAHTTHGFLASRDQHTEIRPCRIEPTLRLEQGKILYHQGDAGETIYKVKEGVLRLSRVTVKGRQQVVAFAFPGDTFGFPVKGRRHTDCDALVPSRLVVQSARMPGDGSVRADELASLARAALHEIGDMQEHLMILGRKSSREKVAAFLSTVSRRLGEADGEAIRVDLPMGRTDIADYLGLRTETVSRAFTDLRQSGIISLGTAQSVSILDPEALDDIAEGD